MKNFKLEVYSNGKEFDTMEELINWVLNRGIDPAQAEVFEFGGVWKSIGYADEYITP